MYNNLDPNNPGPDYVDNVLMGIEGWDTVDHDNDGVYSPDYNGDGISDADYLPAAFWAYRIAGLEDPRTIPGFLPPGTIYQYFVDDVTTILSGRADFEWQLNETHLAKTGLELIKHNIKKNQLQNFLNIYQDRYQASLKRVYDMANLQWYSPSDAPGDTTYYGIVPELYAIYVSEDNVLIPIYNPNDYYKAARELLVKEMVIKLSPGKQLIISRIKWMGRNDC
jgi:hypothetical protein